MFQNTVKLWKKHVQHTFAAINTGLSLKINLRRFYDRLW